jgi:pyruvate-ferredoxin/flavodoxin oxidoreductase
MEDGLKRQKLAMQSGQWLLYRYDPRLKAAGKNPLQLDSPEPNLPLEQYLSGEDRFRVLLEAHPKEAQGLIAAAQKQILERYQHYQTLSRQPVAVGSPTPTPAPVKD